MRLHPCFFAACSCFLLLWHSTAFADELGKASAKRVQSRIEALSKFGKNAEGGVDRVAYSRADREARAWVMAIMEKQGLADIRIDAGGNIIGRRPGFDKKAKPIMFGSHIDSVLGGGNYDGDVGVITALEAIDLLNEARIETKSALDIVIFSNEEGGLIGSLAMTGALKPEALSVVSDSGLTIRDGIIAIGGDPENFKRDVVREGDLKAFIELHIEQGGILDAEDIDIGVVEGIVGIEWWDVTVEGFANHAGTTPMDKRNDALLGAAKLVQLVNEVALEIPGRHVATVGRIKAFPGAPNVIPGKVELSLEIRDLDSDKIERVYEEIEKRAGIFATDQKLKISFERINVASHPALTDKKIRAQITNVANELGLSSKQMPSGAGHDAQDMARIAPTGMIFVPSVNGVSHSPNEFTSAKDMANGADVLVRTLLLIDQND